MVFAPIFNALQRCRLRVPVGRRVASVLASLLLGFGTACATEPSGSTASRLAAPAAGIGPQTLAIIINRNDPQSEKLGRYYAERRGIPAQNIIRVTLPSAVRMLNQKQFASMHASVLRQTGAHIQAYAMAWMKPYRVDCMSITTAMTFGFDRAFCSDTCRSTRASDYYDADTTHPFDTHKMRPSMLLAGSDYAQARALIDRGLAADSTAPGGTAYLLSTSDKRRNVRAKGYPQALAAVDGTLQAKVVQADSLRGRKDVMFYFTGAREVADIASNRFLPGAIADHLTSAGGRLLGQNQMSILRWLDAGATGSYGAVVEPCNFPSKFPNPEVVMRRYAAGETLLEAYWKSVRMPGQGVFVGEPLARPYGQARR